MSNGPVPISPVLTPAQLLLRLSTVDGQGSGLDADMVHGVTNDGTPIGIPLMPVPIAQRNTYVNSLFRA